MTRPNQYNVFKGDCLVFPIENKLIRLIITDVQDDFVISNNGARAIGTPYAEAVVKRKKDGKYLIGAKAEARFYWRGFGGIKIKNDNSN